LPNTAPRLLLRGIFGKNGVPIASTADAQERCGYDLAPGVHAILRCRPTPFDALTRQPLQLRLSQAEALQQAEGLLLFGHGLRPGEMATGFPGLFPLQQAFAL